MIEEASNDSRNEAHCQINQHGGFASDPRRVGHCPNFCQNDAKFSGFTMVNKNTMFVDVETLETFLWKCESVFHHFSSLTSPFFSHKDSQQRRKIKYNIVQWRSKLRFSPRFCQTAFLSSLALPGNTRWDLLPGHRWPPRPPRDESLQRRSRHRWRTWQAIWSNDPGSRGWTSLSWP